MHSLPNEWGPLLLLVFALGARHGIDPDHLAAIDGLTRCHRARHPRRARWCGALFSLGHGLVVTAVALIVQQLALRWAVPGWLGDLGNGISIAFLLALGTLNLVAVRNTAPDQMVRPVGVKARWLGRLLRADTPLTTMLVGALFALSFDTMSQTALFALAGAHQGGIWPTVALAVVFTGGMMTADGLNGLWISRLLARADRFAIVVSRAMGTAVGVMSLAIAVIGIGCWMSPAIAAWFERAGPLLPLGALCAPLAVFLLAQRGGGAQQEFLINRLEVGDER